MDVYTYTKQKGVQKHIFILKQNNYSDRNCDQNSALILCVLFC